MQTRPPIPLIFTYQVDGTFEHDEDYRYCNELTITLGEKKWEAMVEDNESSAKHKRPVQFKQRNTNSSLSTAFSQFYRYSPFSLLLNKDIPIEKWKEMKFSVYTIEYYKAGPSIMDPKTGKITRETRGRKSASSVTNMFSELPPLGESQDAYEIFIEINRGKQPAAYIKPIQLGQRIRQMKMSDPQQVIRIEVSQFREGLTQEPMSIGMFSPLLNQTEARVAAFKVQLGRKYPHLTKADLSDGECQARGVYREIVSARTMPKMGPQSLSVVQELTPHDDLVKQLKQLSFFNDPELSSVRDAIYAGNYPAALRKLCAFPVNKLDMIRAILSFNDKLALGLDETSSSGHTALDLVQRSSADQTLKTSITELLTEAAKSNVRSTFCSRR
jgi:hypothetical protein